jgi:hypothetical protein
MQILTACLCDSAADYQGKLCILGAFDTIAPPQVPVVHPACALALRFISRAGDEGAHQIRLALIDSDGRDLLPPGSIKIDFNLPPLADNVFFASHNVVLNLQGLPLSAFAAYSFDVYVDGEIATRVPLQVVKLK